MTKALVDTDIFSEILRSKNDAVRTRAQSYIRIEGRLSISAVSVMEAAAAIAHDHILVTGNEAHYRSIAELGYALTIENWRVSSDE